MNRAVSLMILAIPPLAFALAFQVGLAVGLAHAGEPLAIPCESPRVIDGDTIECAIDGVREPVRVVGVDTPEMRGGCDSERTRAREATARAAALVYGADRVELLTRGTRDRYGRILARVRADGEDLAGAMIRDGLGVPYAGGQRQSWCQPAEADQ